MKLHEFISLNSIFVGVNVDSKKNVFKTVANFFEKKNPELSGKITEKLNEREKLGTTAVGNGVAIPHTKIEGLKKTQVLFIKLNIIMHILSKTSVCIYAKLRHKLNFDQD